MPTNNFKLFDENKANLLTDIEYGNSTQRLNGVQTGVASSQLNNKFAYQVSLVAYAIAQLMNANGLDASDTLAVSAFVGNLQGAILQKVADKATSAEAAAGVLSNKYITPETMKAAALLLSGGVMNGVLNMGGNKITNLGTPTEDSDAVTKEYVDGKVQEKVIYEESFNVSGACYGSGGLILHTIPIGVDLSEYVNFNEVFVQLYIDSIDKIERRNNNWRSDTTIYPWFGNESVKGSYDLILPSLLYLKYTENEENVILQTSYKVLEAYCTVYKEIDFVNANESKMLGYKREGDSFIPFWSIDNENKTNVSRKFILYAYQQTYGPEMTGVKGKVQIVFKK